MTGQVSCQQFWLLVSGIVRIDERRVLYGFIVILIIVFNFFSIFIFGFGGGGRLTSGWDVITVEDTESVDSSFPSNGIKFSIVSDVLIFANSLIVSSIRRECVTNFENEYYSQT